jgi:tetratricopeptide (TPR) repeat protein
MNVRAFSGRHNSFRATHRTMTTSTSSRFSSNHRNVRRLQAKRSVKQPSQTPAPAVLARQGVDVRQQALAKANQGDYATAIVLLNWLIECNPDSAIDYNNRGLVYFQQGAFDQALADYNRAIDLNPSLSNVYNNRANYYATQGQLLEAIADYDTALDFDPANIRAWLNQGITFRDLEMYERAIENFDLALQLLRLMSPSVRLEGHLYAERGRAYHLAGDWNCAIADYRRALAILSTAKNAAATDTTQRLRLQVESWLSSLVSPL